MSDDDAIPPMQEPTGDSEVNSQPKDMHINTELPNYLINIHQKEELINFLCNILVDKKESGLGYNSNGDADKVLDIDTEVNLARLS